MLYLIATPLGNIKDITLRALELLTSCDLILCEDTRHSQHLLKTYHISVPTMSYHKFNEAKKLQDIVDKLQNGKKIALISDAGTPCIQDPGTKLVKICLEKKIPITTAPGPCALTAAISLSGEDGPFQFVGFSPKKEHELEKFLFTSFAYAGQTLCFVSSHQIEKVLKKIAALDEERNLLLMKELTKIHEKIFSGTAAQILKECHSQSFKGEFVLLIKYKKKSFDQSLSIYEHVLFLEKNYGLNRKEAIKEAAKERGVHKSIIYKEMHSS